MVNQEIPMNEAALPVKQDEPIVRTKIVQQFPLSPYNFTISTTF